MALETLRALFIATDRMSPEVIRIRESFVRLEDTMDKAQFRELKKQFREVERNMRDLGGQFAALGTAVGTAMAGMATAVAGGVAASVNSFTEYGGAVDDAVNRTGVGAEAFQRLAFAAQMSGSSAETMERALIKLNQGMSAAASGSNKQVLELFDALNIELTDAEGNVRAAADVMPELARAFQVNENAATRTRMAMALFGRAGTELVPMFADLDRHGEAAADGMDAWRIKAERFGLVLSEEQVGAAAELGDQLDLTRHAFSGLATTVGAEVTPVLLDLLPKVQDFIAENREFIGQKVASTFQSLASAISRVQWDKVVNGMVNFTDKTFGLIDALGGLPRIIAVVGGAWAGLKVFTFGREIVEVTSSIVAFSKAAGTVAQAAGAFGKVGAAISMLGKVIATTPLIGTIALIVAGLTALGIWVYDNWDSICAAVSDGLNWISEKFDALCSWFSDTFPGAASVVEGAMGLISEAIDGLLALPDRVKEAWNGITGYFGQALDDLTGDLKDAIKNAPEFLIPDAVLEWANSSTEPPVPDSVSIPATVETPAMPELQAMTARVNTEVQPFAVPSVPHIDMPVTAAVPGSIKAPVAEAVSIPATVETPAMPELQAMTARVNTEIPRLSMPDVPQINVPMVMRGPDAAFDPALDGQKAVMQIVPELSVMPDDALYAGLNLNPELTPVYGPAVNPPPEAIRQTIIPVYADAEGLASPLAGFDFAAMSREGGLTENTRQAMAMQQVTVNGSIGIDVRAERGLRARSTILQPAGSPVVLTANQGTYR